VDTFLIKLPAQRLLCFYTRRFLDCIVPTRLEISRVSRFACLFYSTTRRFLCCYSVVLRGDDVFLSSSSRAKVVLLSSLSHRCRIAVVSQRRRFVGASLSLFSFRFVTHHRRHHHRVLTENDRFFFPTRAPRSFRFFGGARRRRVFCARHRSSKRNTQIPTSCLCACACALRFPPRYEENSGIFQYSTMIFFIFSRPPLLATEFLCFCLCDVPKTPRHKSTTSPCVCVTFVVGGNDYGST